MRIIDVEQGTDEWLESRLGVITGTRLKSVVGGTATQKTLMYELIGEKLGPKAETKKSGAMERGNVMEEILKESYSEPIEDIGFIKKNDWIGLSPDGVIRDKEGKITRAFEIKSPLSTNYIRYWLENKIPAEYKWQVVHYFVVIEELESLEFIIFNPEMRFEELKMKKITVTREELKKDIETANTALKEFREKWNLSLKKLLGVK